MRHFILLFTLVFISAASILKAGEAKKAGILMNYDKIPLAFTINNGQFDSKVKFVTRSDGAAIFFTEEGATFLLNRKAKESFSAREKRKNDIEMEYYALKKHFVGANPNPEIKGMEKLPWSSNYLIGKDHSNWRTEIANYSKVRLYELYTGIDLVYYGNKSRLEYDFIVEPKADPNQIILSYDFGDFKDEELLRINSNDELVVKTPFGNLIERKPYCYQLINGKKIKIDASFKIVNKESNNFTFSVCLHMRPCLRYGYCYTHPML